MNQDYTPPIQTPSPHGPGYEFTSEENVVIAKSGLWARGLGIAMLITAAFGLLGCNVFGAAVNASVGTFMLLGGNSLDAVVRTEGNDVAHMMTALNKLGTAFMIRIIVLALATLAVLGVAGMIALYVASNHGAH